jgi:predicted enzyme related to lactoylglutathione lyase
MSTPSSASEITAVRQIALTVSDVERAAAFYRDSLGLKFLFLAPPSLAFLDAGGVRLMLAPPEGEFKSGASAPIYFKVADIIGAHRALSARGVTFTRPPHFLAPMPDHDLWLCEFNDPDGNHLALMCERPKGEGR